MSRGLNKLSLIGNVGNEPEIRATQSGARLAKFSLATNRSWTDKNTGEKQERVDWHAVTFFGPVVEVVERFVKKGDRIFVEGRVEYSTIGEGDQKKYFTNVIGSEIIMLGGAGGAAGSDAGASVTNSHGSPPVIHDGGANDADLPF